MFLDSLGMTNTKILAKVETRQALLNIRGILACSDGIVFSRYGKHPDLVSSGLNTKVQSQTFTANKYQ